MTNAINETQLFNYSTHNSEKRSFVCWDKRPCYRLTECAYCKSRKIKFIKKQFVYWCIRWRMKEFVTITLTGFEGYPQTGIKLLLDSREALHRTGFNGLKYITCVAIAEPSERNHWTYTPHYHCILSGAVDERRIRKLFKKKGLNINIHHRDIDRSLGSLRTINRYLLDVNYFPSLQYAPKNARLLSASRGIKLGRPCALPHIEAWEAKNGRI